jgi:hypothetical protein
VFVSRDIALALLRAKLLLLVIEHWHKRLATPLLCNSSFLLPLKKGVTAMVTPFFIV